MRSDTGAQVAPGRVKGRGDDTPGYAEAAPPQRRRSDRRDSIARGSAHREGRPDVLVLVEEVRGVVAALDVGQPLVRAARIRGPDSILALGLEEVRVDARVVRLERLEQRLRPGPMDRLRGRVLERRRSTMNMTGASRWANAVASEATRLIAPPRTRSWIIVKGEVRFCAASRIASTASSARPSRNRDRWTASDRFSPSLVNS